MHFSLMDKLIKHVFFVTMFISISSCAFDQRKKVAYELLYQEDGFELDEVYLAAVTARFPPGSHIGDIKEFTTRLDGTCNMSHDAELICEIPVRGFICAVRLIQIKAVIKDDAIQTIAFLSGGLSC